MLLVQSPDRAPEGSSRDPWPTLILSSLRVQFGRLPPTQTLAPSLVSQKGPDVEEDQNEERVAHCQRRFCSGVRCPQLREYAHCCVPL